MEFPHLGNHCSKSSCNKLDFLPIKCDACHEIFCNEHYHYSLHDCPNAYKVTNQVPVCPLCNVPVPVARGQQPDAAVGEHMDNDCQSDPAKSRRKVFNNRCSRKGCKTKEFIPVICNGCKRNFCLKHRHAEDHNCQGKDIFTENGIPKMMSTKNSKYTEMNRNALTELYHGTMTEDEALARALATSMQETSIRTNKTQEELDHALALQLQASDSQSTTVSTTRNHRDRCNVS